MNNEPFISVIVPVYNGEKTIGACIESLLAQEYPRDRCEIVIVDNKSTDNTPQIVKGYRVRYLLEDRIKGSYAARNAGIRNAKGSILAFTDADCVSDKEWLKKGIAGFTDDTVGCIAGGIEGQKSDTYIQEYLESKNMLSQRESSRFFGFLPYAQTANALYKIDDELMATNMSFLRLVMTETERKALEVINRASDAEMNAMLVSADGVEESARYNVGVQIRGGSTR